MTNGEEDLPRSAKLKFLWASAQLMLHDVSKCRPSNPAARSYRQQGCSGCWFIFELAHVLLLIWFILLQNVRSWLGGCLILKGVRTWIRPIARRRAVSRRMSHYFCVYSIYMYHVYSGKQTYYILVSWKMGLLKVYFPWSLLCLPEGSPCYLVALNFSTFTASFLFGLREIVACTGLALWGQDCTGRIFHDLGWMRFPNIMWGIASNAEVFLQSLVAINWRSRHGAPIWVWPPHYHLFARGGAEFCIDSWSLWNWWAEDVSLLQMRIHFANLIGWRWENWMGSDMKWLLDRAACTK